MIVAPLNLSVARPTFGMTAVLPILNIDRILEDLKSMMDAIVSLLGLNYWCGWRNSMENNS
jgi:hypothetical protein